MPKEKEPQEEKKSTLNTGQLGTAQGVSELFNPNNEVNGLTANQAVNQ